MEVKAFLCSFKNTFLSYKLLQDAFMHGLVISFFLLVLPEQLFCGNYPRVVADPPHSKPCSPHSFPQKCVQAHEWSLARLIVRYKLKRPPWKVYRSGAWSHLGRAAPWKSAVHKRGMQQQLQPLCSPGTESICWRGGKEAEAGCTWWVRFAPSVVSR